MVVTIARTQSLIEFENWILITKHFLNTTKLLAT